ncbi:hypothetical protein [Vibrio owensii]|uniref:hypothetical protein n=1 Tax=Vibrio owensii TaxID=696485 RepID=UPI003CC59B83
MKTITKNNRFTLNGIEERVLLRPETRDGIVKFTMGGMSKYATELPLSDFEEQTGYIIQGLEPEVLCKPENELAAFMARLEDLDMTIQPKSNYVLCSAGIEYTTASNSRMSASVYARNTNQGYKITVTKSYSGGTNVWDYEATDKTLPSVIRQAEDKISSVLSQRVQVMSSENSANGDREYSDDGFPVLFKNETLNDYFKSQDMKAGIVINANGKYQYFHSFESVSGPSLHHDTKDYKTLKGCAKKLASIGYDEHGRQLDIFPTDEARAEFEQYVRDSKLQRDFSPSWNDNKLGEYKVHSGSVNLSSIQKVEDPKFGFQYFIEATFTNEFDGRQHSGQIAVNPQDGGNAYQVGCDVYEWTMDLTQASKSGSLQYDEDHRTLEEKVDFHMGMLKNNKQLLSWANERFTDSTYHNEAQRENGEKYKAELQEKINHHDGKLKELGRQIKAFEQDNDLDHGSSNSLSK